MIWLAISETIHKWLSVMAAVLAKVVGELPHLWQKQIVFFLQAIYYIIHYHAQMSYVNHKTCHRLLLTWGSVTKMY